MHDPVSFDLASLSRAFDAGLTPERLVDLVFDRIEAAGDPGIFIALADREAVRAAARALPPRDPANPLWGVPFAVKDNIDAAGFATTAACPAFAYRPARNAHAVQKLVEAGALVVGKTNLDQFATGLVGVRTPYPVPRNAFDPAVVPGGSSSGSAVAVARGLVAFALGTDTAGSGRVPAGLNNLVGLKPTVGAVSTTGVAPACRTLDCVSVFATTVDDAYAVFRAMAGFDAGDPFSRRVPAGPIAARPEPLRLAVPDARSLQFAGDALSARAFGRSLDDARALGATLVEIDLAPFFETATLLYHGAFVAERMHATRAMMDQRPDDILPVTREIIGLSRQFSAADAFDAIYRQAALRRETAAILAGVDALIVPTYPRPPTLAELAADPHGPNMQLGTYTNFVNLLDLCALAVPGRFRDDGFPSGVTLIAPAGRDAALAAIGADLHAAAGVAMGATRVPLPKAPPRAVRAAAGAIEVAVVGAHLSGMALNHELQSLGARFLRAALTTPDYRLFALPGGPPWRPGLLRVGRDGHAIACEVWALPPDGFGSFVAGIPSPLTIGSVRLDDGTTPKGFLVESEATVGAEDISHYGGWRSYMRARAA